MELKSFSRKKYYFEWKTEPPTINQPRRSQPLTIFDTEVYLNLEAKFNQFFNLVVSVWGTIVWNMSVKATGRTGSIILNHLYMTVYMQGKDGLLDLIVSTTKNEEWIWSVHESDILHQKHDFIVDGLITFICVIDLPVKSISELEMRYEPDRRDNPQCCQLKFSEDIQKMLVESEYCDVLLICDDYQSFNTHRCILAARSDVFAAMFRSNMLESNIGVVYIREIDSSVFHQLLQFIYSGKICELTVDKAVPLYEAADRYAVLSLRHKCATFLMKNLTEENVSEVFYIAEKFVDKLLMDAAVSFVAGRRHFLRSEEWRYFAEQNPTIGTKVYQRAIDLLSS